MLIKFFQRLNALLPASVTIKDIILMTLSFLALSASFFKLSLAIDAGWLTILLCGVPIIFNAFCAVIKEHDIKADFLVSLALLASIYIGEIFAAAEIAFIMQLGTYLEEITVRKAKTDIEKLISLSPQSARRIFEGEEHLISAEFVHVNDIIKVLPGETVPVDGVIIDGQTAINQAVMTGEALPVDKNIGDNVYSGTINQFGAFTLRATKTGADSSMQRMIKLIKNADVGKTKIVGLADKWATYIVIMALCTALFTWIFTGDSSRAVTVLVVFCPCALVLATPTAIMAAIANATSHGFLVRQSDALERLSHISQFVFDKTGTLTTGKLQVTTIQSFSKEYNAERIYQLAASLEAKSEHPIGKAVVRSYKEAYPSKLLSTSNFSILPGQGLKADLDHAQLLCGNLHLLEKENIHLTAEQKILTENFLHKGNTIIYLAKNKQILGFIALADTLRMQSAPMLNKLKSLKTSTTMLTGDNPVIAANVAQAVNIDKVQANCLPEDKLNYIRNEQAKAEHICMLGDGINDAPALKEAYFGIAMGGIGSDIAIEAADIILTKDKIEELPHLFQLSKHMLRTIKVNLIFALILNFTAIILAVTGYLQPVVGALIHNGSSILVILNSVLLLKWHNTTLVPVKESVPEKAYTF